MRVLTDGCGHMQTEVMVWAVRGMSPVCILPGDHAPPERARLQGNEDDQNFQHMKIILTLSDVLYKKFISYASFFGLYINVFVGNNF